ncbi:hypothetical protein CASFOL_038938 [Castilleja foliolosa]|uniref:Desiccation-related protein PCC13-62-like n=1 Tax=Castilleja foliolosa TaxID=1961234 RepID=A0ABD3BJB6_9LAMI
MQAFFTSSSATILLLLLPHLHGCDYKVGQKLPTPTMWSSIAFNLDYLETEFFLFGAVGKGLDDVALGLSMGGPTPIGRTKAKLVIIKYIIEKFGYQEVGHLRAIKIHVKGFPRPQIDISAKGFADFMDAAFKRTLIPRFNPYDNDINFLIASYAIPYVGLTGYVAGGWAIGRGIRSRCSYQSFAQPICVFSSSRAIYCSRLYAKISGRRDRLGNLGVTKDEGIKFDKKLSAEGKVTGNVLAGNNESLAYD